MAADEHAEMWRAALQSSDGELHELTEAKWCTTHNDHAYTDEPVAPERCSSFNMSEPCVLVPLYIVSPSEEGKQ